MSAESAITAGGTQPGTGPLSAVCRTVSDPPPLYSSVERLSHEGLAGVAHLGACRESEWVVSKRGRDGARGPDFSWATQPSERIKVEPLVL